MIRRVLIISLLAAGFAGAQDAAPVAADAKKVEEPRARLAEIELNLDGTEDPHAQNPFGGTKLNYYGFLRFVRKAAKDPELDAIILKPKTYGVGIPRLLEVRNALMTLRQSGKKVFFQSQLCYIKTIRTHLILLPKLNSACRQRQNGDLRFSI